MKLKKTRVKIPAAPKSARKRPAKVLRGASGGARTLSLTSAAKGAAKNLSKFADRIKISLLRFLSGLAKGRRVSKIPISVASAPKAEVLRASPGEGRGMSAVEGTVPPPKNVSSPKAENIGRIIAGSLSALPRLSQPFLKKLKGSWDGLDRHHLIHERIQSEISSIKKIFKKKLEKFLVINFDPTMAEIIYVEPLSDRLRLLAYDTQDLHSQKENKEQALAHFINHFLQKNAVSDGDVILSISDADSIFIKDFVLPVMPEEEILKAAKWQLKDDVLFDLEKASLDWRVLGEFVNEQGEKGNRTIFIAANNEVVGGYLSLVQSCQLDPLSVTSGAFNYAHILENLPQSPRVAAILDVGHTESTFGIYADHKLNFVRKLPISWEKLMQSLTKVLISDSGVTQFTYEQAEEITKTVGIPEDGTKPIKDNIHASHLMSLMRPLLEALSREIKFSLDYFTGNFEKDRPAILYLTGDSAGLKNLDKYLSKEFHMEVSYLSLPPRVDTTALPAIQPQDQNKILNAVGAALGGLQAINLLPFEIKAKRLEVVEKAFLRFVAIIAGAVFIFSLGVMHFQVANYQNRIRNAKIHLQTMEGVRALAQKVKEREDMIRAIEGGRVPLEGVLKTVSAVIPPQVVLEALELDPREYRLILKGTVSAGGEATEAALADFLRGLETSSFFTDVSFISSQRTGTDYKFEVKCDVYK